MTEKEREIAYNYLVASYSMTMQKVIVGTIKNREREKEKPNGINVNARAREIEWH